MAAWPQPGQGFPQHLKALVNVPMPGDQTTFTVFEVGQRPEPVVLEFKEPVRVIERFQRLSELGGYNRREHA
jgi:hypothetical protein